MCLRTKSVMGVWIATLFYNFLNKIFNKSTGSQDLKQPTISSFFFLSQPRNNKYSNFI